MENRIPTILHRFIFNNLRAEKKKQSFKCYDCDQKFETYDWLVSHAMKKHKGLIGEEDIHKYLFDRRYPDKVHLCVICKKNPVNWNPKTRKYCRYCEDPKCKEKARKRYSENMIRVYNTDNLLKDPERQEIMIQNRKISGIYTFADSTQIKYVGKYEKDFLRHCEHDLGLESTEICDVPPELYVKYYDNIAKRWRYYIPDKYLSKWNCVIEIKDGSKYPVDSKEKVKMKDAAVLKLKKFHYIKIVDKDYTEFDKLIEYFRTTELSEIQNRNWIYIIPELKLF